MEGTMDSATSRELSEAIQKLREQQTAMTKLKPLMNKAIHRFGEKTNNETTKKVGNLPTTLKSHIAQVIAKADEPLDSKIQEIVQILVEASAYDSQVVQDIEKASATVEDALKEFIDEMTKILEGIEFDPTSLKKMNDEMAAEAKSADKQFYERCQEWRTLRANIKSVLTCDEQASDGAVLAKISVLVI